MAYGQRIVDLLRITVVLILSTLSHDAVVATEDLRAPNTFTGLLYTDISSYPIVINVERSNAPLAADRFYTLLKIGFFNDSAIFRSAPGFVLQFGVSGSTTLNDDWHENNILDEPAVLSNIKGTVSFANAGEINTRSTELFINLVDNVNLDTAKVPFVPFGVVETGMTVVNDIAIATGKLFIDAETYIKKGNAYVHETYPNVTFITSSKVVVASPPPPTTTHTTHSQSKPTLEHSTLESSTTLMSSSTRTEEVLVLTTIKSKPFDSNPAKSSSDALVGVLIVLVLLSGGAAFGYYWYKQKTQYSAVMTLRAGPELSSLLNDEEEDEVYPFDIESDDEDSDEYQSLPNPFESDDPFGATSPINIDD
eukprot:m.9578 g.9578  ORF g.9578 m.9578 type:complete len:365 (-) comp7807_c0_seq1:61-1155(-)